MGRFPNRFALLVLLSTLLAACGGATRIVYENADGALLLMAEQYLDLEREQWATARGALAHFHAWHRHKELPEYAVLLESAADRTGRGLTRDDLVWGQQALRERYRVLVAAAAGESAPLLASLGPANRDVLERKFSREHQKRTRELGAGDAGAQERRRVEKIVKRFETWTGSLSGAQKDLLVGFVRATPDYPQLAEADRYRKQRELVELLASAAGSSALADRVRAFLIGWESNREGRFAAIARDHEARLLQVMLELDRTLDSAQRNHMREKLARYAADARFLSRAH